MTDKTPDNDSEAQIDAAYEAWFIKQVQASIDDPRPSIPDDEARRLMAKERDLLKRSADR
ncbi:MULTISPECIES: antitoxin PaaA2 family protein [Pseudomonas]